jgi:putative ABC transport system permease protein
VVTVLAAVAVSVPLLVGSAEAGTWERERARSAPAEIGTTYATSTVEDPTDPELPRAASAGVLDAAVVETATSLGLARPLSLVRLRDSVFVPTPDGLDRVLLFSRTGAADDVEVVAGGADDDGVLVPARLADATGLVPGDTLRSETSGGRPVELRVSGVYADLPEPLPPYWAGQEALLTQPRYRGLDDPVFPTVAVIAPISLVLATADELESGLFLEWFLPLPGPLDVDAARSHAERLDRLRAGLAAPRGDVVRAAAAGDLAPPTPASRLPEALGTVDRTVALLVPPVRAVGAGGAGAALVLVGAWAGQRVRRRESELRALLVRGLSPARAAGAALREAVLPAVIGTAVGGAAGRLLVRALGPSPELADGAAGNALLVLGAGAAAALALVPAVTAAAVRRMDVVGRRPRRPVPWVAVAGGVTVAVGALVLSGDPDDGDVALLPLVLPLLATVVVAGAVTAALPRLGRRGRARLDRLGPAAFLALSRVVAGHGAARLVVVTTALSLALVVQAGALADSAARTIEAKAAVAAASDVVVPILRRVQDTGPSPAGSTVVERATGLTVVPGGVAADVLAVRPGDLADVVDWDPALADRPFDELVAALAGYSGERVPVLLAGPFPGRDGTELVAEFARVYAVPIEVVGRVRAFPGQTTDGPLLVADRDGFAAAIRASGRDPETFLDQELWARGEAAPLLGALTAAGWAFDPDQVITADAFAARPELNARTWSFGHLRGVAVLAGLLGLTGLALQAVAQQRRRAAASVLLTRMGMAGGAQNAAAALESGLLAGLGALVAVGVALPASALLVRLLDPVPAVLPGPVFAVPWGTLLAVGAGTALATAAGALLAGRAARQVEGGRVMRDAP